MGSSSPGLRVSSRQMRALQFSLGYEHAGWDHAFGFSAVSTRGDVHVGPPLGVSRLKDLFGSEYVGTIAVGTADTGMPQAELNVIYDTGSSDLMIASDLCKAWPCDSKERHRYNHSRSLTFREPAKAVTFETTYGSGQLSGRLGIDDVRVGPLVSTSQSLGLITQEQGALTMLPLDGIVGLGFPDLAIDAGMSLVNNFASQGSLARQQFAFYLHRDLSLGGGVLWGGVDSRLYDGELQWFPVVEKVYWALDLLAFQVGNYTFNFSAPEYQQKQREFAQPSANSGTQPAMPQLIVDSGTTFYTAEGEIFDAIMRTVTHAPCAEIDRFPPLVYTLRNSEGVAQTISVPPEEYFVDGGIRCFPAVVNMGMGPRPTMILGEVFMRHYFTVFSADGPDNSAAVGFARSRCDAEASAFLEEQAAA